MFTPYEERVSHRLARSQLKKRLARLARRPLEITPRQQQTQRTLLDSLRVEYAIEKPSNQHLAVAGVASDAWV